jgi:predicted MFS family arabinose efflux permease
MLFAAHCVFCNLSSSIIFLHLPALILSFDLSMTVTSLALTVCGLANCFGKICHSVLGIFRKPDTCVTYTFSLLVCGTVMILFPLMQHKIWILFMAALLGSTYCVTGGYTPEVIMNLVGTENISDGLGFGQVAKATGSTVAGPLAGRSMSTCIVNYT